MICEKCKNEFIPQKGLKKYCSLKCRNSRIWSTEDKEKKRNAIKNNPKAMEGVRRGGLKGGRTTANKTRKLRIKKACLFCNKMFDIVEGQASKQNTKYCSLKCMYSCPIRKANISKRLKEAYVNGKQVFGGKTKWIEIMTSHGLIKVQGTYEIRTCIILDKLKQQNKIVDWEYTKDRIKYIGLDNKTHSYLLDFKITTTDGWYYLETKGYKTKNDDLKWKAVRDAGFQLIVWYENNIAEHETI